MSNQKTIAIIRFFGLFLVLASIATVVLAACGGTTNTQTATTTGATPTATSQPTATPSPTTAPTPTPTPTAVPPTPTPKPPPPPPPTPTPKPPPAPKVVQVSITTQNGQFAFSPASITIPKGSQVVWTNNTGAPHTVTSDNHQFTSSGIFNQGQTFTTTFATAGTFAYHCSIHTYMTATIIVTG